MPIKIAINGFGRIGRPVFRRILDNHPDLEVVAINDLTDKATLKHLLKYDSLYGIFGKSIDLEIQFLAEKDPENLPWKKLGVDVVLECTGLFTEVEGAKKHLEAGAKKIIISAPSKSKEIGTFVLGVNEEKYDAGKDNVVSMASCTTNCLAPVAKVLNDSFKIVRGFMTTIHSYTNDQRILDLPHKDLRRARAAALNIVPTSTGAASAIGKVIPELEGKLDGIALRVPTPTVSTLDLICLVEKETTSQEVNYAMKKASQNKELKGILGVEDAPLVSSDYKGNSFSAIVDSPLTMAIDNLIKVVAWYDNEWGYACRLAEFAEYVGKKLQ
ncbi:MAG: type I glyceraldehyde-3-phosphate dehydrogenase [Parcubacteria group bacterium CG1_02_39_15]|uniref:Glyceraldehyde-3-phosphate dehydrogenase n=2 Tax=Candidatus Nealsoniibacteriota TaxID=1817911 RepID=A0A2H0MNM2_9BACT|nr:MAG: type I glyceraldehyde-3-phosphate dehydrogenase [Parcubacteria group bacterium CG1_02_39_15]PIQ98268.1 MAG: type I glyceraldehyde-3-phosphate dehydrogenase [Candidatus Nealsonbacteria bacterium CG11_big_fil_rev_8_21_14_0_20_39_9]PIZ88150.1 MAG: type I glyceraldehyde-3-phosphate dehydrogenase [Candidatus Nealsonbacteria bacterium CG_4_10_14_0_2_um_filter_39_15]